MGLKCILFFQFFLLVNGFRAASQEVPGESRKFDHFLEIGLGVNYHALRDEATSPLTYKGFQPAIHIQYFFDNHRFLGIVEENFFMGSLVTRNYSARDKNKAKSYNNELSFGALYNIRNFAKSSFFLGGEFSTLANFRQNEKFNNANINYEVMASLSPIAMFEYQSSWKAGKLNLGLFSVNKRNRDFKMQYALSVPVFTTLFRPGYVTISDFVDYNSLVVDPENIYYTSLNHFFQVKNRFILYYILHNNNMLKFNYNFSYYNFFRNDNPVKGFHSTFFLSVVFRFTNNTL